MSGGTASKESNDLRNKIAQLYRDAVGAHQSGDDDTAIKTLVEAVNLGQAGGHADLATFKLLGFILYRKGDFRSAFAVSQRAHELFPDDIEMAVNLAVIANRTGQPALAVELLEPRAGDPRAGENLFAALSSAAYRIGDMDRARRFGQRSLEIKLAEMSDTDGDFPLDDAPVPPFDPAQPERNVIAFCLWGDDHRYRNGALRNARLAKDIYPGWRCRFYLDGSVPRTTVDTLRDLGAEIIGRERKPGSQRSYFWRYEVANDENVDRYLVRDADAVINTKERVAVDDWISSQRHFHVMRDFITHTELVHAGLWGGVGGALPALDPLIDAFFKTSESLWRTADQMFLRRQLWPIMRQSVVIHDSVFNIPGSKDFPPFGGLAPGYHIGQSEIR